MTSDPNNDGTTPLTTDERQGLIADWVATRADLNAAERDNIGRARASLLRRRGSVPLETILTEQFLKDLHRRMCGTVWKWAGQYRRSDKNIGPSWYQVPIAMRMLVADALAWRKGKVYATDEFAVRFAHRLVSIHPWPNVNGRHSRLTADLLAVALGSEAFSWGGGADLALSGAIRGRYIAALRRADAGFMEDLIAFARS
jgi:Fic-DOC domain mobile mystery protein B